MNFCTTLYPKPAKKKKRFQAMCVSPCAYAIMLVPKGVKKNADRFPVIYLWVYYQHDILMCVIKIIF